MSPSSTVVASLAMSLDGFIAFPDDSVGPLFDWYFEGPEEVRAGGITFSLSPTSADVFRRDLASVGAFLVGRRLFDHTGGWGGHPPVDRPMVVLTHEPRTDWPPVGWPADAVPVTFATDVWSAVTEATSLAARGVVSVAGGAAARACLDAGLLDQVHVHLVPVALGKGVPLLAGLRSGPVRFEDPEVIEARGVTHLRYRVRR